MKILTAMYTLRRGGAYERFIMMIEAFLEREVEFHILSLTPIPVKHAFFHNHIIYYPFNNVDGLMAKIWVFFVFPFGAVWVGWRNKIDLIVAFGSLYAFLLGLSKKIVKRPMVTLVRLSTHPASTKQKSLREAFLQRFQYIGLTVSDRIITNFHIDRDDLLKRIKNRKNKKIDVLYNNILPTKHLSREEVLKIREKYGIPSGVKLIVTAGIINPRKNMGVLIKCLVNIDKLYLIIAGDSLAKSDISYRDSLKQLARELRIDQRVIFAGWLQKDELLKIYQASDLFVLPSINEGMPNAMLEALGVGLVCMGSNIPGIKDVLYHEDLMFDPLDEQALADKIRRLFSDSGYLSEMKRLCQERKKTFLFDWKEKVYEMALGHLRTMPGNEIERRPEI